MVCIVAAGVLLAAAAPRLPAPSEFTSGDAGFAREIQGNLPADYHRLAVAVVEPGGVRYAGFGADAHSDFEIGSISKAFTGMLLADSVDRGEVMLDTTLGELFDLGTSPAAGITLENLATHRSGLPRLPAGPEFLMGALWSNYTAGNPYGGINVNDLITAARSAELKNQGTYLYSNFGVALLGQALAQSAGMAYPELLASRITGPLNLTDTYVPLSTEDLRTEALTGRTATGKPSAPWTMDGFAPAGGIRSSAADLALLASALLNGSAPGSTSLDLVEGGTDPAMGLAWHVGTPDDQTATALRWHDGGTGGFSSILVLDLERNRAAVALGNVSPMRTDASVDQLGTALLFDGRADDGAQPAAARLPIDKYQGPRAEGAG